MAAAAWHTITMIISQRRQIYIWLGLWLHLWLSFQLEIFIYVLSFFFTEINLFAMMSIIRSSVEDWINSMCMYLMWLWVNDTFKDRSNQFIPFIFIKLFAYDCHLDLTIFLYEKQDKQAKYHWKKRAFFSLNNVARANAYVNCYRCYFYPWEMFKRYDIICLYTFIKWINLHPNWIKQKNLTIFELSNYIFSKKNCSILFAHKVVNFHYGFVFGFYVVVFGCSFFYLFTIIFAINCFFLTHSTRLHQTKAKYK